MSARKVRPDVIVAEVAMYGLVSDAAQLATYLALARDDRHGVYADSCRYQISKIDEALAEVRAVIAALPARIAS